ARTSAETTVFPTSVPVPTTARLTERRPSLPLSRPSRSPRPIPHRRGRRRRRSPPPDGRSRPRCGRRGRRGGGAPSPPARAAGRLGARVGALGGARRRALVGAEEDGDDGTGSPRGDGVSQPSLREPLAETVGERQGARPPPRLCLRGVERRLHRVEEERRRRG